MKIQQKAKNSEDSTQNLDEKICLTNFVINN